MFKDQLTLVYRNSIDRIKLVITIWDESGRAKVVPILEGLVI